MTRRKKTPTMVNVNKHRKSRLRNKTDWRINKDLRREGQTLKPKLNTTPAVEAKCHWWWLGFWTTTTTKRERASDSKTGTGLRDRRERERHQGVESKQANSITWLIDSVSTLTVLVFFAGRKTQRTNVDGSGSVTVKFDQIFRVMLVSGQRAEFYKHASGTHNVD